jgi:carotenoid cleavage dioxygenase-like enzyme
VSWKKNTPGQKLKVWSVVQDGFLGIPKNARIEQLAHSMSITEDYIVLGDSPFQLEAEMILGGKYKERRQPSETTFWIVKRSDLTQENTQVKAKKVVLNGIYQHFFVNYVNPNGEITFFGMNTHTDPSIVVKEKGPLQGVITSAYDLGSIDRIHIVETQNGFEVDHSRTKEFSSPEHTYHNALFAFEGNHYKDVHNDCYFLNLGFRAELFSKEIENLYCKDHKKRRVPVDELPHNNGKGTPCSLFLLDFNTMLPKDEYIFPDGVIALSPVVIPVDGSNNKYLTVVVNQSPLDQVWIFDANALRQGPIAVLTHPDLRLGFTLHTALLSELPDYKEGYKIDAVQEVAEGIAKLKIPEQDKAFLKVKIVDELKKVFN